MHFCLAELMMCGAGAIAVLETGRKVRARCLIGTDGANSRVARALDVPKPNYAGYAAYRSAATLLPSDDYYHIGCCSVALEYALCGNV